MKKIALPAGIVLLFFVAVFFVTYKIVEFRADTLPDNSPRICDSNQEQPRLMVLGDSITHGRVSANYVDLLQKRHPGYQLINAGINGHLAYDGLGRLNAALKSCKPRIVLVLLGTNDINATLSEENHDRYVRSNELPRSPNREWYLENMEAIVDRLREEDRPEKFAIYTIPPIGEKLDSQENRKVADYNRGLRDLSLRKNVPLLELNQRMAEYLAGKKIAGLCGEGRYYVEAAVFQRYLLGRSWNETANAFGFHLTTDCLHFNETAAALIADLARPLVSESSSDER